jgi:protein tyrosine phosphatase domain-containing protein 1
VTAVFNLQQAGEHEICGDGLAPGSGFSYRPETFMDAGSVLCFDLVLFCLYLTEGPCSVFYYNFGWKDMTTPPLPLMMSVVQVVAFHLENGGRVSVHCHAGLGM